MKKCFTINCMRTLDDFIGYKELLKNNLYQGIEIFYPYNVTQEQKELYTDNVNKIKNEINPEIVLHMPFGGDNDFYPSINSNKNIMNRMIEAIDYSYMFGAKKLTLHLGNAPKEIDRKIAIDYVIPKIKELCEYTLNKNMFIMIENMPGYNELGYSPDELLYIMEKVNMANIKFILDTGHANCSCYEITEYIYKLKNYLYHIHFSDNHGKRDEHQRVNSGNIDFKKVFMALNDIKYHELHCMEVLFKEYTDLILYAKDIDIYDKYYLD